MTRIVAPAEDGWTFGPFSFRRARLVNPDATSWHFLIQLAPRVSIQILVLRFLKP